MEKAAHKIKRTRMDRIFDGVNSLIMAIVLLIVLYPFINMLAISLSDGNAVLRGEITFYPKGLTTVAYSELLGNPAVLRGFGNSIFVASIGGILSVFMTILAAYPMAYGNYIGKKAYTLFILIPHWFVAGMIPTYMVVRSLGLVNSLWALIVLSLVSPYHVIILNSFMRSLPGEISESAKIDGANDLRILFQIILPVCKASIATVALWVVVGHWNEFMGPLMYLTDFKLYTLQLVLRDIIDSAQVAMYELGGASSKSGFGALSEQMKNAMIAISILPMVFFYPFIQKYFVTGVTIGSVKG